MKQILEVRSNAFYLQPENAKEFELQGYLEIIIIHTDGKYYKVKGGKLETTPSFVESRLVCSSEQLTNLITDLNMHQKNMDGVRKNAEKLTRLVKYIEKDNQTPQSGEAEAG